MPGIRSLVSGVAAVAVLLSTAPGAWSQNLNVRETAPPSANAKIGRVLSKVRSQEAERGTANLNRQTVNQECGPVEIGNTKVPTDRPLRRDEQITVVPGDVINICR